MQTHVHLSSKGASATTGRPLAARLSVPKAGTPLKATVPSAYTVSGFVDVPLTFDGFYNSNLDFAAFPGVWGESAAFQQTSAAGCDLNHAVIFSPYACDFSYANLQGAIFNQYPGYHYSGPNPAAFNLRYGFVDLALCNTFYRADLTGADLSSTEWFAQNQSFSISSYPWGNFPWSMSDFTEAVLVNANLRGSNFAGSSFIGANLTGANLEYTRLDGSIWDHTTIWPAGFDPATIPGGRSSFVNYAGQTLTGYDFSRIPCMHGDFSGATLIDCDFNNNCAAYANFAGAHIQGNTMLKSYTPFPWADFTDATVCIQSDRVPFPSQAGFGPPNLAHSIWRNAQLTIDPLSTSVGPHDAVGFGYGNGIFSYCTFDGMKCPPGHMLVPDSCNLSYSTFVGAVLYDGDTLASPGSPGGIGQYIACYCDFTNVKGGWFQEAVLVGSTFHGADLRLSTFEWANLCDVDFTGAIVTNEAFTTALTGNAYLGGAGNTTPPTYGMLKATYNAGTIFPAGIDLSLMVPAARDFAGAVNLEPTIDATGLTFTTAQLQPSSAHYAAYDGNFKDTTFVPLSADSLAMDPGWYNNNFRGAVWTGGEMSGAYQSNYGNPAPTPTIPRSSVGATASQSRSHSLRSVSTVHTPR